MYQQALTAMDEDCPPDIDHRKKDNPYKSKYGNQWKRYLKKSVTFSHSVSIADYIDHMMTESKRVMKGTIHEDTWMIYHDALSLMTSKGTNDWMKKKGYYERWVLPSEDLYDTLDPEIKKNISRTQLETHLSLCHWMHISIRMYMHPMTSTSASQMILMKIILKSFLDQHRYVLQVATKGFFTQLLEWFQVQSA